MSGSNRPRLPTIQPLGVHVMVNAWGAVGVAALMLVAARAGAVVDEGRLGIAQAQVAPVQGTWTSDARAGWTDRDGGRRWQFNLRADQGDSHWGFGIRPSDIEGVPAAAIDGTASDVRFSWTREAGVFGFSGSFDRGRGAGRYVFTPAPAYLAAMQGLGYRLDGDDALRFAVLDVTTSYVRELAGAGYAGLPFDELTRMRIHQVTPEFVRGLATRSYRGLPAEELVRMRIHRVSLEEIDELIALGFGGIDADELVRFRIHKVTPAYIREMRDVGFTAVTDEQLVRMRIHKVDARFVKDARADGYAMTTPGEAIDLAIHGPRYTRARRQR